LKDSKRELILILIKNEGYTTADELALKIHISVSSIKRLINEINAQILYLVSSKSSRKGGYFISI